MTRDPWRYDERRVVVTGCASGIGLAVAQELATLGAQVVGLDRNPIESPVVAEKIGVDLTDERSVDEAVRATRGSVDVLFNCAGISGAFPARDVVGVNFIGMRHLTESLVGDMTEGSAVVGISSTGGVAWQSRIEVVTELCATSSPSEAYEWCEANASMLEADSYNVSKSAVIFYTMLRTVALASRGIRINAVGPGPTETPFLDASRRRLGDEAIAALPKPLGRFARAEEQARALVFLGSDAASYISGQNLWVDGGYQAGATVGDIDGTFLGLEPVVRQRTTP